MAASSGPTASPPAPWRAAFLRDVGRMESPEFVFSSLHSAPVGSPTPYLPRARYCVFRGFWAELPENDKNPAPQNERVYESEMPSFTTDVRMDKALELFMSAGGRAGHEDRPLRGSGGGGPCEAVWWVKGDVFHQWRIKGEAFLIANDIDGDGGNESTVSNGARAVKGELSKRMRAVRDEGTETWSWSREVTGHFGNMSPGMRGSFKAPPPGQPVDQPYDDKHLRLGEKVDALDDAVARENFRVVVIKPEVVESLDLSDAVKARRHVYKYEDGGTWSHEVTWP